MEIIKKAPSGKGQFIIYLTNVIYIMTEKNKKSRIKDINYLVIQGFMVNQLNLKGNDLLIYAVIYGFSQTENQKFTGSLQYLADWTQSTKQGVINSLKKLIKRELIIKEIHLKNKIKLCKYYATKLNRVLNLVEQGIQLSLTGGIKQSLPNNKDTYNITNNKEEEPFSFFKDIYKQYNFPKKITEKGLKTAFKENKRKLLICLNNISVRELNCNIENYLDYLKVATWRGKMAFSVFINKSEKYSNDWVHEKTEALKRQTPKKLTEKEKIMEEFNGK